MKTIYSSVMITFLLLLIAIVPTQQLVFPPPQPATNVPAAINFVSLDAATQSDALRTGSLLGGNKLYIKGSGLDSGSNTQVLIGTTPCPLDLSSSSTVTSQLVCIIPASPISGEFPVTVAINNVLATCTASTCYYKYSSALTPAFQYIVPSAVTPNTPVKVAGLMRVEKTSLLTVNLNNYFCNFDVYGDQALLPNEVSWGKCQIDSIPSGYYAVDITTTKGKALKALTVPVVPDTNYSPYDFLVAPEIMKLSSNSGPSSGEEITITGKGFSTVPENNVVSFEGHPCTIVEATFSKIRCSLKNPPMPAQNVPRAGHAGVIQRIFPAKNTIDELKKTPDFINGAGSIARVLTFEIPFNDRDDYAQAMETLFKAPVTGSYQFLLSANRPAELYISTTPLSKTNLVKIAQVKSGTGFREFFDPEEPDQISSPVSLEAGKYYFLQALHLAQGTDYLTVGVRIPNSKTSTFNPREVVSVKLVAQVQRLEALLTIKKASDNLQILYVGTGSTVKSSSTFNYPANAQTIINALSAVGLEAQVLSQTYFNFDDQPVAAAQAIKVQYRVRFLNAPTITNLPGLNKPALGGFVKATDTVTSPLVSGTYELGIAGKVIPLKFDATSLDVENAFNNALGIPFATRVFRYGRTEEGCQYIIYFNGKVGDTPDITLSSNSLQGGKSGVTVDIKVLQSGNSDDTLLAPIPANLLYTLEQNPQITVRTNGVLATCSGNCKYQPVTVTNSITITGFTLYGKILEIEFVNAATKTLADFTTVTFGGSQLIKVLYDQTSQKLNCTIPLNPDGSPILVAGPNLPTVNVLNFGFAAISKDVLPLTLYPQVYDIRSQELAEGFFQFTVIGANYGLKLCDCLSNYGTKVEIGGVPCKLTSLNNTVLVCQTNLAVTNGPFSVTVNKITTNAPFSFINDEVTADLTNDCYIDLIGTGFTTKTVVKLVNTATQALERCRSCTRNSTLIRCATCGLPPGDYNALITTPISKTESLQASTPFKIIYEVSSIEPKFGSVLGGTVLTLKGKGFSETLNKNQVSLGCKSGCKNLRCDVIESSHTELKCLISPNSLGLTGQQGVFPMIGLEFDANCIGDCSFTFSEDHTPTITQVSSKTIKAGDEITFDGTLLSQTTQISFNGLLSEIVQVTPTQITVRVPAISASATVSFMVTDPAYGHYYVDKSIVFTSPVTFTDFTPKSGSRGGTLIKLTGTGFSKNAQVFVAGKACQFIKQTPVEITCQTPINVAGAVTVTQDTFKDITCSGCTFAVSAALTPIINKLTITPSTGSLQIALKGTQLNIASPLTVTLKSTGINQEATIVSATATDVTTVINNPIAGSYTLEVKLQDYIPEYQNIASLKVNVAFPQVLPVQKTTVSRGGGQDLMLSFSGVTLPEDPSLSSVLLAGFNCPVNYVGPNYLVCTIPPLIVPSYKDFGKEVVLVKPLLAASASDKPSLAFDGSTATSFTGSSNGCYLGIDVGRDLVAELSQVQFFPKAGMDVSRLQYSVLEGSNDGTTFTVFRTLTDNIYEGFNTINFAPGSRPVYRYYRFRQASAASRCELAELKFKGIEMSSMSSSNLDIVSVSNAVVTINQLTVDTITANVEYRKDITPIVTSISPKLGTSAGGTQVTISGNYFVSGIGTAQVFIDKTECTVTSVTTIKIICTTGALPDVKDRTERLNGIVEIKVKDRGMAVVPKNVNFLYAERWSESKTWGCDGAPLSGDSVHVPVGMNLFLDIVVPKLVAIVVEGGLIFDDWDNDLHCDYLMIRGGLLRIGTEDQPMQSQINITLYGNRDDPQLPIFGNKAIAVYEGVVDIHGTERVTLDTKLTQTANAGSYNIYVENADGFNVNDVIVISSTSNDPTQNEQMTILSKAGNVLTLDTALKYTHLAEKETFDIDGTTQTVEIRALVGLLTRNIVIMGDESSEDTKYGAHMLFYDPGTENTIIRMSYTELKNVGQAGYIERHPINFQNTGNQMQSYIVGCSIHSTFNKGIQVRGTQYLRIANNILFNIENEGIILPDGSEKMNTIEDNVIIQVTASLFIFNSYRDPGAIKLSNPLNFVRRNKVGGVVRNGFTLVFGTATQGASNSRAICPQGEKLGAFEDNYVLSCGSVGLFIDAYFPRTFACRSYRDNLQNPFTNNQPIPAVYKNFFAARTQIGFRAWRLGSVVLDRFQLADSQYGGIEVRHVVAAPLNSTKVTNAFIVGNLQLANGNLALKQYWGILVPSNDGFTVDNAVFAHFDSTSMALQACSNCANPWEDTGSRVTLLKNLKFSDVAKKVDFTVPYTHIFRDLDGTLTSLPTGGTVVYNLPHLRVPECQPNTEVSGLICDSTVEVKGINFWNVNPGYMREKIMRILRLQKDVSLDSVANTEFTNTMFRYPRNGYSAPFVTGYAYQVSIDIALDFDNLLLENSPYSFPGDEPITIAFNYTEPREDFDVIRKVYLAADANLSNLTTPLDVFSPEGIQAIGTKSFGSFYNDVGTKDMYFLVTGNNVGNLILDGPDATKAQINAFRCKLNCPQPLPTVAQIKTRYWSDPNGWPGKLLPVDGGDVLILENEEVILDVDTPSLGTVEIQGKLTFTDTRASTILSAKKIWVRGKLEAGTVSTPFGSEAIIRLTGTRLDEPIVVNFAVDAGTKVMVVTGELSLVGKQVTTLVRLVENADVDATTIKVSGVITSFKVGDQIVIAPSSEESGESEVRIIKAIDSTTNVITLDQPLKYFHYGSNSQYTSTNGVTIDLRTEVLLLKRYVRIEGTQEDGLGARVVVTDEYGSRTQTGVVTIKYASMSFCGQASTDRAGLTFELSTAPKARSIISESVFQQCVGYAVRFEKAQQITFQNNLIYNTQHYGVKFHGGNKDIKILNNVVLHIKSGPRPPIADLWSFSGGIVMFDETNTDIQISQNIVAGCSFSCYLLSAPICGATNFFIKNIAHSGKLGYIAYGDQKACISISDFSAYRTRYGVISNYRTNEIQASKLFLTDNVFSLNLASSADEGRKYKVTDSFFAGIALLDCPKCYTNTTQCSGKSAFGLNAFTNDSIPDKFQFYRSSRKLVLDSSYELQQNYFENFQDNLHPSCVGNKIFYFSERAIDFVPYITTQNAFIKKVQKNSLAWFSAPFLDDYNCGPEEQCTVVLNSLIEDKDGSLVNIPSTSGSLLPNNKGVIDSSKCQFYEDVNGHVCDGLNYALLGFKSLDISRSLIVLSPIEITNQKGFRNVINSHRNNNPRHDGDTQKYTSLIQTNEAYNLAFPRDIPLKLQFELQGALPSEYVLVKIKYNSRKVISVTNQVSGIAVDPCIANPGETAVIKPEHPCGTYIFDREEGTIQFKITGESTCRLVLEQTNSLVANIRFDITLDEFFEQGGVAPFIDKVAAVLNIPSKRIKIVGIYKGSVGIIFSVDAEEQGEGTLQTADEQLEKFSNDLQASVDAGLVNPYKDARVLSFDQKKVFAEAPVVETDQSQGQDQGTGQNQGQGQGQPQQQPQTIQVVASSSPESGFNVLIVAVAGSVGVLLIVGAYIVYRIKKSKKTRNVVKISPEVVRQVGKDDQKSQSVLRRNPMISINESKKNLATNAGSIGSFGSVDDTNNNIKGTPTNKSAPRNVGLPSIPEQSKRRMSIEEKIEEISN